MEMNNGSDDTREMLLLLDHYRREKGASDHVINAALDAAAKRLTDQADALTAAAGELVRIRNLRQ